MAIQAFTFSKERENRKQRKRRWRKRPFPPFPPPVKWVEGACCCFSSVQYHSLALKFWACLTPESPSWFPPLPPFLELLPSLLPSHGWPCTLFTIHPSSSSSSYITYMIVILLAKQTASLSQTTSHSSLFLSFFLLLKLPWLSFLLSFYSFFFLWPALPSPLNLSTQKVGFGVLGFLSTFSSFVLLLLIWVLFFLFVLKFLYFGSGGFDQY